MQLSASVLPFDLPPATVTGPTSIAPTGNPSADPADFGALLNAQSAPVSPASIFPATPVLASAPAEAVADPLVELPAADWLMEEVGESVPDVTANSDFSNPTIAGAAPQPTPLLPDGVDFAPAAASPGGVCGTTSPSDADVPESSENGDSNSAAIGSETAISGEVYVPLHGQGGFSPRSANTVKTASCYSGQGDATAFGVPRAIDASPAKVQTESGQRAATAMPQRPAEIFSAAPSEMSASAVPAATSASPATEIPPTATTSTAPQVRAPLTTVIAPDSQISSSRAESSPIAPAMPKSVPTTGPELDEGVSASRIEDVETPVAPRGSADASALPVASAEVAPEKFAAIPRRAAVTPLKVYKTTEKNTETAEAESVERVDQSVGTNVAKPEVHMPPLAPHAPSAPHAVERLSHAVAPLSFESSPGESASDAAEFTHAARRAVNAAVAVTEQFAAESKSAVTLKFTVSGVDLGVRVELRGENIHTTFRTDSPELRAALAQEWQTVATVHATDRASRLAEPVFTSNSAQATGSATSNGSSQSDSGNADHRGSQNHPEQRASEEWARFRAALRINDATANRGTSPSVAPRSHTPSAPGRLHTFA